MPVDIGTGTGQFPATISHVNNGEYGNEVIFRRPSIDLENRTDALHTFANTEETRLDAVSNKADANELAITALEADTTPADLVTHVADSAVHTVYASTIEAKAGTEIQKVISPSTLNDVLLESIGAMYDAIVGDIALAGVTHANLAAAIAASSDGWKILVTKTEFLNASITIANDNIEIEFRRGAYLGAGAAPTGLIITGNDCYISKGRFIGFPTEAVRTSVAATRTTFRDTRYSGNTVNLNNLGTATSILGDIVE